MILFVTLFMHLAQAQEYQRKIIGMSPADCSEMEIWDYAMGMCMPLPMEGMPMKMLMLHGNSFLVQDFSEKPRGREALAAPNMIMADVGTSLGSHHYINLDFMGTLERWTYPNSGYPELLQIGEENANHVPYIDAQHPHSSPVMGLTLSDTIALGHDKDHLKISLAPRGEATDGPIAFMHRVTGMMNPDAPLGHHVGQDVGHITSSLVAAGLKLSSLRVEASTYHGQEPSPTQVDLPLGTLDSYSFRVMDELSPTFLAMASYAYVTNPESDAPDISYETRTSASVYNHALLPSGWSFDNSLIFGSVSNYDHASVLISFAEEFVFAYDTPRIWGRVEVLQRTPNELQISTAGDINLGQWVTEVTLGYTHKVKSWESAQLGVGGSVTGDILPTSYQAAYGGNPWTAKIFVQFAGMKMWDLKN